MHNHERVSTGPKAEPKTFHARKPRSSPHPAVESSSNSKPPIISLLLDTPIHSEAMRLEYELGVWPSRRGSGVLRSVACMRFEYVPRAHSFSPISSLGRRVVGNDGVYQNKVLGIEKPVF